MYIEHIHAPADVKKLTLDECNVLAKEMRATLLKKMSICGGHFGPNFGMVEATIALHFVFSSPRDKFIFDVSHQSYCHKMLTGRMDAFLDADKYRDVTGYSCPAESEHDHFNIGHTSTSISLASGMAKARDLAGRQENILAIIGDGALGGGEAMEGLNFAGTLDSNFIVIVNDNNMSIAENHGALYKNLKLLRETNGQATDNLFHALGFDYRFLKDGHNIEALVNLLKEVKDINHPIVVHICTQKGKDYLPAESDQENWHWRPPFHIETGELMRAFSSVHYDNIVCDFLMGKMKKDPSVVTIVAGVPLCIGFTEEKRREAGPQFVDVGIAEEHAVAMAAGIASNGGKPIFATHASFFQRVYDQISQELCINCCPATLLVRNASVFGMNDVTHLGIFDIPLLSNIPNLVYLAPTNKQEYLAMLDWSIEQREYPVAIRIPKTDVISVDGPVDTDYSTLNRYKICIDGSKIAILALGTFYGLGESVTQALMDTMGLRPTLINPRYITGLDEILLHELKKTHDIVVTLEDGILDGGFGEKITRFYGTSNIKVLNYGLKKEFVDLYVAQELLRKNRLTAEQIVEDIRQLDG